VTSQTSARLLGGGEEGGQDEVPDRRAAGVVVEAAPEEGPAKSGLPEDTIPEKVTA